MKKNEKVLHDFLLEKFEKEGVELNEKLFNGLSKYFVLEEGIPNEEDEIRSVMIKEDTDGKLKAKSIKLYNLLNVSIYDFVGFLLKEFGILISTDVKVKIILSVLNLIYEFYPKMGIEFNEKDSKILLLVYEQKGGEFTSTAMMELYNNRFDKKQTETEISRSLSFLVKMKVLKYLKNTKQYIAREKFIYERK